MWPETGFVTEDERRVLDKIEALSRKSESAGSVALSDVRGNADYCVRMMWDALNRLSKTVKCTDEDLVLFKAVTDHPHMKQND